MASRRRFFKGRLEVAVVVGPANVQRMISARRIRRYVQRIVDEFSPSRVILFGSHAAGSPHRDSDVDLLVVMPHSGPAADQAARIRQRIPAGFPLDLVVRSPATVRRRLLMDDSFLMAVMETGKVLHDARRA